ncbi:MAG: hypothetical protein SFX73_18625 [Kofleriaceae bacterium]|nr:hypothetical protein [Kofleriaceae bacterium]
MRTPRLLPLVAAVAACAQQEPSPSPATPVLDRLWSETIRSGDVLVLVPGTGSYDYLGAPIEALPVPQVNVREHEVVRSDAVVFEQAIAAARRAGFTEAQLEAGELSILLWGAGFTRLTAFDYISYEGIRLHIDILGGTNAVASGEITDNLFNYTGDNANLDARDLYQRTQAWLAQNPSQGAPRNVVVLSHSWGGAVAEYLALELPTIAAQLGPLTDGSSEATMPFTVAAGVPGFILGYHLLGPVVRDYARPWGKMHIYEVDRPDDPVHAMSFDGDYGGHHYNIVVGDDFRGSYGITTLELSCHGQPGACGT